MNDETALATIEAFFRRRASRAEYEAALAHFQNDPAARTRLAGLYRELVAPGGMTHAEADDLMLLFEDKLAWRDVPEARRQRFLLHLSECPSCTEQFLEMLGWEDNFEPAVTVMPRFKLPTAKAKPNSPTLPTRWQVLIQKAERVGDKLRASLQLRPVLVSGGIAESGVTYAARAGELLFIRQQVAGRDFEVEATATGATLCTVTITTEAGVGVRLRYDNNDLRQTSDERGRAVFENVPQSALAQLDIEISPTT